MALELPGQLRTSMAVPALRSLPPGLGVSGFHQETPQAALSQVHSCQAGHPACCTQGSPQLACRTAPWVADAGLCAMQLSHEQLCAKVRVLEAEVAELRLQV